MKGHDMPSERSRTTFVAVTATMGALVVVFDYGLKFSGLKIPFPWLPFLKFDFSGIPIVLAFHLCGLVSGGTTCVIAFLGILVRSGDVIGASMKGVAEFSTILGMAPFYIPKIGRRGKILGSVSGIALRILMMSLMNLVIMPTFYGIPFEAAVALLIPIAGFNTVQGGISIVGGWTLYQAVVWRMPALADLREKGSW
jgi:riboflavin transporter FmnP